jgi:hypothetical protein
MSGRLIRRELALEKIGICASTFHKLIREVFCRKAHRLRRPAGIVGWYEDVIDAYVEQYRNFPRRRGDPRKRNIQTTPQNGRTQVYSPPLAPRLTRRPPSQRWQRPGARCGQAHTNVRDDLDFRTRLARHDNRNGI